MKVLAVATIIASAMAIEDQQICTTASDCSIPESTCCNASKTGNPTVKLCVPSMTKDNDIKAYAGYTISCLSPSA